MNFKCNNGDNFVKLSEECRYIEVFWAKNFEKRVYHLPGQDRITPFLLPHCKGLKFKYCATRQPRGRYSPIQDKTKLKFFLPQGTNTVKCISDTGIEFFFAALPEISLDDYILYRTTVYYYTKQGGITPGELADEDLISDQMFRLVINGLLITKYGLAAMLLKKVLNEANIQ